MRDRMPSKPPVFVGVVDNFQVLVLLEAEIFRHARLVVVQRHVQEALTGLGRGRRNWWRRGLRFRLIDNRRLRVWRGRR